MRDDENDDTRHQPSGLLPTDEFSMQRRALLDNPGALRSSSRLDTSDFYGRAQTWVIDTFRTEGSAVALVQRMGAQEPLRLVLPAAVMAALSRQGDTLAGKMRSRRARKAVETRRERGDTIGNPDALRRARSRRKKR